MTDELLRDLDGARPGTAPIAQHLVLTGYGDRDAFQRLYDATARTVFALIRMTVPDRGVAEQVCRDAFVEIWRRAPDFDPDEMPAFNWLLGIARRHARRGSHHPNPSAEGGSGL